LPDRQQTLRGALDWSYRLLTLDEQKVFTRLAIFQGGATLTALEEVADYELSDSEISEKLVISSRTVNSHLTNIYSKLNLTSRVEAVHFALQKVLV
jgi:DNA-binding CsgD family transcriptional regulator